MRKHAAVKRSLLADPKYNSILITQTINLIMMVGKKAKAQFIVYQALQKAERIIKKPALEVYQTAITHLTPELELKSRRVGGANYQIPIEVRAERKEGLAIR